MAAIKERYSPMVVGVNSTVQITSDQVGGFLCKVAGTISLVRNNEDGTTTTIVDGVSVSAGVYTPLPFYLSSHGGTFTTAGGASGTLGV